MSFEKIWQGGVYLLIADGYLVMLIIPIYCCFTDYKFDLAVKIMQIGFFGGIGFVFLLGISSMIHERFKNKN